MTDNSGVRFVGSFADYRKEKPKDAAKPSVAVTRKQVTSNSGPTFVGSFADYRTPQNPPASTPAVETQKPKEEEGWLTRKWHALESGTESAGANALNYLSESAAALTPYITGPDSQPVLDEHGEPIKGPTPKEIHAEVAPTVQRLQRKAQATMPTDATRLERIIAGTPEVATALAPFAIDPLLGAANLGAQGFASARDEAEAKGLSERQAGTSGAINAITQAGIGLIPFERAVGPLLDGLAGKLGGKGLEASKDAIARIAEKDGVSVDEVTASLAQRVATGTRAKVAKQAVIAAGHATTGAGMMGASQLGANIVAQQGYDPTRPLMQNVPEAAGEGALFGAAMHGATAGLGAATRGVSRLRERAAENKQRALDALTEQEQQQQETEGADYGTFDVISRDANNKVQREQVKVISEPDENGMVTIQRADGSRPNISLEALKQIHVPSESIRSVPLPDTMSRPAIVERLRNSLGNFEPDEHLDAFIKKTADHVADAVTLGRPEAPESYLKEQDRAIKAKRKISEESRIGHSLVVDEARKVLNEYTDLVTAPPEGAAPKVEPSAGEAVTTPPIEEVTPPAPPPSVGEVIQNRAQSMREENARRTEMLDRVANDPNAIDKPSAYEDMLDQSGYGKPTPHELAHLHDAMRLAAEHETALNLTNARVEDIHAQEQRQAGAGRVNVIEDHLYDPEVGPRKKIDKINADLEAAGLEKLNEDEVNRYQAVADAVAAYGPKGERQQKLDEIMSNPRIKDKYEAFRKRVGEPNEEEATRLGSGTSEIEAQIKPSAEQPGVAPTLAVERGQAPGRSEEIASEAEAANQRLNEAAARAEQSRAEVDRINTEIEAQQAKLDAQPHKGTPAARQAINTLKDLEAERAAAEETAPKAEEVTPVEKATPKVEEAPAGQPAGQPVALTPYENVAAPKVEEPAPKAEAKPAAKPEDVVLLDDKLVENKPAADVSRKTRTALGTNWRMSKLYQDLVFQYGSAEGADRALAEMMGLKELPREVSVGDAFELVTTRENGLLREVKRLFSNPMTREVTHLKKEYNITPQDISDALQARAAAQRNAKVGTENGSGMTNTEGQAILTDLKLSGKLQKMDKVIKLHDAARDYMQKFMVDHGLVSKKQMDQWIAEEPDYTPFKGWAQSGDITLEGETSPHVDYGKPEYIRTPMGISRNIVRKAEGRTTQAANSLYNLIGDLETAASKAARNEPAVYLLDLLDNSPYGKEIGTLVKAPTLNTVTALRDGKPYYIELADTSVGRAYHDAFTNLSSPNAIKQFMAQHKRLTAALNAIFFVPNRAIRAAKVAYSPLWWPNAIIKDIPDAIVTAASEQGIEGGPLFGKKVAKQAINYINPFKGQAREHYTALWDYLLDKTPTTPEAAKMKQLAADFVQNGSTAGYAFREQASHIEARIKSAFDRMEASGVNRAWLETKEGAKALQQIVHGINDYLDMVPRFAVYHAAVDAGIAPRRAARVALESSLNLPRRGRYGSELGEMYWFINAAIQSTAKKGRMLTSPTGRKILATHALLGAALGAYNTIVAGDNNHDGKNDYLQQPAWEQAAYITIYSPFGDGHNIKLPLGFMVSFEVYFGQKMGQLAMGAVSKADAAADLLTGFIGSQIPMGQQVGNIRSLTDVGRVFIPSAAQIPANLMLNRDAFGNPIYNEPFNKLQAHSSVPRASTPEMYKDWAKNLNEISGGHGKYASWLDTPPEGWKYLIDQFSGGLGKFAGRLAKGENPYAAQYTSDNSHAAASDYYAHAPRMRLVTEKATPDERAYAKEKYPVETNPRVIGAYKAAEHRLDGIKAREINLQKSKASPEQKQIMADKIEADKQEAYASFLRTYNAAAAKQ